MPSSQLLGRQTLKHRDLPRRGVAAPIVPRLRQCTGVMLKDETPKGEALSNPSLAGPDR
jgi:hypothetical protein